jgi:hypothetical protein
MVNRTINDVDFLRIGSLYGSPPPIKPSADVEGFLIAEQKVQLKFGLSTIKKQVGTVNLKYSK